MEFPVIDLFAGPGGLGEGFSSFCDGRGKFKIIASAEKDVFAHKTLTLRAYFRCLQEDYPEYLSDYYDFCAGRNEEPWTERTLHIWEKAKTEALLVELGSEKGNTELNSVIVTRLRKFKSSAPLVLIGGPPCQAYSIAGRVKNMKDSRYDATKDQRNFLYKEYLKVLEAHQPAVFVMENVKGILSSKIDNKLIFHQILSDLADPSKALFGHETGKRYVICSLVKDVQFHSGDDPSQIDSRSFIVKSEEYGIPQCRHRVILLGIREDCFPGKVPTLKLSTQVTVGEVLEDLGRLRSRFSKIEDSSRTWSALISESTKKVAKGLAMKRPETGKPLVKKLKAVAKALPQEELSIGALRYPFQGSTDVDINPIGLASWYRDSNLKLTLNHETRGHILKDIVRYCYAACFAEVNDRSPRGHSEYDLVQLSPSHKNWESGKFVDRFRVQQKNKPASTITSHISKDGHYFIHYDPTQARSLTVREAARIQTFPDNYFFQGPRTQQYQQVGNAVPPLLAKQIADVVAQILKIKTDELNRLK
ncbi:DNA cytosine methyltransferase [Pseudidiomarina sp. E22-M8]|uniref:DNA cytosine methyltransferase n=1 Tax=Pseudidiomarina sp. E22-M8 TaxID=3424768 RepID=UPI00403C33FA